LAAVRRPAQWRARLTAWTPPPCAARQPAPGPPHCGTAGAWTGRPETCCAPQSRQRRPPAAHGHTGRQLVGRPLAASECVTSQFSSASCAAPSLKWALTYAGSRVRALRASASASWGRPSLRRAALQGGRSRRRQGARRRARCWRQPRPVVALQGSCWAGGLWRRRGRAGAGCGVPPPCPTRVALASAACTAPARPTCGWPTLPRCACRGAARRCRPPTPPGCRRTCTHGRFRGGAVTRGCTHCNTAASMKTQAAASALQR